MTDSPVIIAPSVLACDFAQLGDEIRRAEASGADWHHLDVMDGHFVNNISYGMDIIGTIKEHASIPLDCHLMIEHPDRYVARFVEAGAEIVTIHLEAFLDRKKEREWQGMGWRPTVSPDAAVAALDAVKRVCEDIRKLGAKAGVSFNPETGAEWARPLYGSVDLFLPMSVWPGFGGQSFINSVVDAMTVLASEAPKGTVIEADGGIKAATIGPVAAAGVTAFVAGTASYRAPDMAVAIREMREIAAEQAAASA